MCLSYLQTVSSLQEDFNSSLNTNNEAKYEALIMGAWMAQILVVDNLEIIGDSQLMINLTNHIYWCKTTHLKIYRDHVIVILHNFQKVEYTLMRWNHNIFDDLLSFLASSLRFLLNMVFLAILPYFLQ